MKWLRRYNESDTIKATDETIREIVRIEINKLGIKCDLNHIDVSGVTNMGSLFRSKKFNGDIRQWNVGNVNSMYCMFNSSYFNSDISKWDVSNVTDMEWMFFKSHFNRDISNWYVKNGELFGHMFYDSPLEGREPWWYILRREFIDNESMYESIEVYEWIDFKRGIIWKKRLNYAFQDFGKVGSQIPESIWGFIIQ